MKTIPYKEELSPGVYSLRVGKKVPPSAVNLAYVHSPSISPQANIIIEDYSGQIPENVSNGETINFLARPDASFLLYCNGETEFTSDNIEITDEFSLIENYNYEPQPLYYKSVTTQNFNIDGISELLPYNGGYVTIPTYELSNGTIDKTKKLVYIGNKISIGRSDGVELSITHKYKVILIPVQDGMENEFQIEIYTNFRNTDNETYTITYQKYNDDIASTTEILNASLFFGKLDKGEFEDLKELALNPTDGDGEWLPELNNKVYYVEQVGNADKYRVYAPSQVIVKDSADRPIQTFRYQVEANLNVNYNTENPTGMNIGVYYNNAYHDSSYESVGQCLQNIANSQLVPSYVTFNNPYSPTNTADYRYWYVDISQPADVLKLYDIIIITGYGPLDLTYYGHELMYYIKNGGKVWIDSCSSGPGALNLRNWPQGNDTSVTFDTTSTSTGYLKAVTPNSKYFNRYHNIPIGDNNRIDIGYSNNGYVGAYINIPSNETWTPIVIWSDDVNDIGIAYRKIGNGTLLISNCGIMRSISVSNEVSTKFCINTLLALSEDIWIKTPQLIDQAIHIDNLFSQEYIQNGRTIYEVGAIDQSSTTIVARKIISTTCREAMLPYMPHKYHNGVGTFIVTPSIYSNNVFTTIQDNIRMTESNNGSVKLWAYSLVPGNNDLDFTSSDMVDTDITIFHPNVEFTWSITPYTYEWDNVGNYRYVWGNTSYTKIDSISKVDGKVVLSSLRSVLPGTPSGTIWNNPNRIFYKLWLGKVVNGVQEESVSPVNIAFYNRNTGEYIYDLSGENKIAYNYLFTMDELENIFIHAWTDYYTLRASKRTFSVKQNNNGNIYVDYPSTEDERDCWFLRVNGRFSKFNRDFYSDGNRTTTPEKCVYKIPEYERQHFNPAIPFISVNDDKTVYIDNHKVKINNGGLKVDDLTPIKLIRRKYSNNPMFREKLITSDNTHFTSDHTNWLSIPLPIILEYTPNSGYTPLSSNEYSIDYENGSVTMIRQHGNNIYATYRYCEEDELTILDIDTCNGIIIVAEEIDYTDEIYADYFYEENFYTYKGYWDGNEFWYLDLNPSEGHVTRYPLVKDNLVINSLIPTSEIINKSIYIYLLPYEVDGREISKWTVRHTFSSELFSSICSVEPRVLLLAIIQIRENATVDDVMVMDTRTRGGGIKSTITNSKIYQTQPLAQHYWDIGSWDGLAYQSNGVIIIKIPKRLLDGDNGRAPMTDSQIKEMVGKYLPYGTFPIIEYV